MKRPLIFPIYPRIRHNDRSRFYRVFIFESKDQANEFYRQQCKLLPSLKAESRRSTVFVGQCNYWLTTQRDKTRNVGQVLLPVEHVGSGLVAHEFTHAAWFFLTQEPRERMRLRGRRGFNSIVLDAWSEPLAQMAGDMVRQFWARWWSLVDRGLIERTGEGIPPKKARLA